MPSQSFLKLVRRLAEAVFGQAFISVFTKKGAFRLPNSMDKKMVGRDGFEPTKAYASRFTVCRWRQMQTSSAHTANDCLRADRFSQDIHQRFNAQECIVDSRFGVSLHGASTRKCFNLNAAPRHSGSIRAVTIFNDKENAAILAP